MRLTHLPLLLLVMLCTVACATVRRSPLQRIEIESQPSGASVRLSECSGPLKTVNTPATVLVSRRATRCTLVISKAGYEDEVVHLQRKPAPAIQYDLTSVPTVATTFGGFLVEAAIYAAAIGTGELIDFASGAKYFLDPPFVGVTLERTYLPEESWRNAEEPESESEPDMEAEPAEPPG